MRNPKEPKEIAKSLFRSLYYPTFVAKSLILYHESHE